MAAALAAKKFGTKLLGALGAKKPPPAKAGALAPPFSVTPKAKGADPAAASQSDEDVEAIAEEDDVDEDRLSDVVQQSLAVALQAQMLRNATALLRRRTKPASKAEPASKHQRLVETLAAMLSGRDSVGFGVGDLFADDGDEAAAGSVFRSATLSQAPVTTSALALRRPGEVFAGGMKQVKANLAALHGDEAVQQRRLVTFYIEVVLSRSLPPSRTTTPIAS